MRLILFPQPLKPELKCARITNEGMAVAKHRAQALQGRLVSEGKLDGRASFASMSVQRAGTAYVVQLSDFTRRKLAHQGNRCYIEQRTRSPG